MPDTPTAAGRTLVVTNDFPPRTGGIESFVLAMACRLAADDPTSVVVHTASQDGDAAFDASLPFAVVRDSSRRLLPTPATTRRVRQTLAGAGCDRVWFGAAAPLALMAPALRAAGARTLVATTHGHEVWWSTLPGTRAAMRRIGDTVDVVTYLGDFTGRRVAAALRPGARERMRRLAPGVDTDRFSPDVDGTAVRRRHGLVDRPVVVCVSRLVERKGQDVLVRALPLVHRAVPGAALLLVGDGPHRPAVQRLVERLGLGEDVVLTGAVPWDALPPYLAAGDVFCMPTRTRKLGLEPEALGIVYLEAAACGLPVVAGDSGGAPDAVRDGETGFVVDGRQPVEVAGRLVELLRDPALAARMGAAGRSWVEREWRWDDLALRLRALLAGRDPDRPGPP